MPNCPVCKSKKIVPIIYGECSDIIKRGAQEGKYLLVNEKQEKGSPILHCKDCGLDWSPTALPVEYITKLRWKIVEFENRILGTKVVELMPDGSLRYYEYYGESKKAAVSVKGKIPEAGVEYVYRFASQSAPFDQGDYFSIFESDCRLQVSYADGYKNVFSDKDQETPIRTYLMRILDYLPEVQKKYITPLSLDNAKRADAAIEAAKPVKAEPEEKPDCRLFFLKSRKADARGVWTKDGFMVLAGSKLASTETRSCRKQVHDRRVEAVENGEVKDWILQTNKLFKGVSPACEFISGGLGDGNLWKNYRGTSAKEDITQDERFEEMEKLEEEMTGSEMKVMDILLADDLYDTYPRGFFRKSLDELNEHFGAHDDLVVTERLRRYCELMMEDRDDMDDLLESYFGMGNQKFKN